MLMDNLEFVKMLKSKQKMKNLLPMVYLSKPIIYNAE